MPDAALSLVKSLMRHIPPSELSLDTLASAGLMKSEGSCLSMMPMSLQLGGLAHRLDPPLLLALL